MCVFCLNVTAECSIGQISTSYIIQNTFLLNKNSVIIHRYCQQDKSLHHKLHCKTNFHMMLLFTKVTGHVNKCYRLNIDEDRFSLQINSWIADTNPVLNFNRLLEIRPISTRFLYYKCIFISYKVYDCFWLHCLTMQYPKKKFTSIDLSLSVGNSKFFSNDSEPFCLKLDVICRLADWPL